MTQHLYFNGQKTTYAYDAFGRIQTKSLYQTVNSASPTSVSSYTYDVYDTNKDGGYADSVTTTTDGATTSTYDLNGNLVKVTSPQGVIQYAYDALNRKIGMTTSNTHQTYAYDALGRLASTTVDKLDGATIAAPLATSYAYDLNGNLVSTTEANGVVESRVYDTLNRLVQIKDTLGSTTLTSFHYGLDPAGHRLDLFEASGRTETYTYDNLYRLTAETINDPTLGTRGLTWAYDLAGNRLTSTDSGAVAGQASLTYTYDANDRLVNVTGGSGYSITYTYDSNGNTLSTSGSIAATYTWDLESRLIAATTPGHALSYIYDDSGTRVSEMDNGTQTKFLIDKTGAYDQVLEEYQGSVLSGTYLRGLDLMFEDRAGTRSFYIKDGLGSTRALTNAGGAVTDTVAYDAYGNVVAHTGTTVNPFLYTGEQFDASLNKLYLRARYLDTGAGRFTSRDTFEGDSTNPITRNHYTYANGDPLNGIDPSGHETEGEAITVSGLTATLSSYAFSAIQFTAAHPLISIFTTSAIAATGIFEGVPPGDPTPFDELATWGRLLRGSLQFIQGSRTPFNKTISNGIEVLSSELDSRGTLDFVIDTADYGIRGLPVFVEMMFPYVQYVNSIRGNWSSRVLGAANKNLGTINRLTAQGVELTDAIKETFTAKASSLFGFTNIALQGQPEGSPGNYRHVTVLITRE